jgi:hypothetical protein
MSLRNATSIDLVTRFPGEPGRVALVIVDGGEIPDDLEREAALHRKLQTYLRFVGSGQFAQAFPILANAELSVEVVCSTAPTERMRQIEAVRHSHQTELFLPVDVNEEAVFRAKFELL